MTHCRDIVVPSTTVKHWRTLLTSNDFEDLPVSWTATQRHCYLKSSRVALVWNQWCKRTTVCDGLPRLEIHGHENTNISCTTSWIWICSTWFNAVWARCALISPAWNRKCDAQPRNFLFLTTRDLKSADQECTRYTTAFRATGKCATQCSQHGNSAARHKENDNECWRRYWFAVVNRLISGYNVYW